MTNLSEKLFKNMPSGLTQSIYKHIVGDIQTNNIFLKSPTNISDLKVMNILSFPE